MTQKTPTMPEELLSVVECSAAAVGFARQGRLAAAVEAPLPRGAAVWESPYAYLLTLPVPRSNREALAAARDAGVAWLDDVLRACEGEGRLVDGYLVLVLPGEPDAEAGRMAREMSLDRKWCRKYVVWPRADQPWEAILEVISCLGLPAATSDEAAGSAPVLPGHAAEALALYAEEGGAARVRDRIELKLKRGLEIAEEVG